MLQRTKRKIQNSWAIQFRTYRWRKLYQGGKRENVSTMSGSIRLYKIQSGNKNVNQVKYIYLSCFGLVLLISFCSEMYM